MILTRANLFRPNLEQKMEEVNIDKVKYEDVLQYAKQLSDDINEFIPPSVKKSKELLIEWIRDNEVNYNPEDNEQ